ncbi:proline-rich proteoglycan 2-like [Erinaceus europaeus]|uniref:Proline-rich proteoglycan 2-like n=1 Tax=Erinaceus europaeus TaxID=9365 RepID=A0ABM3Y9D6_ERIEU|nr:proline-rich proteoglycan 2-like [Erinaceus europaeus]
MLPAPLSARPARPPPGRGRRRQRRANFPFPGGCRPEAGGRGAVRASGLHSTRPGPARPPRGRPPRPASRRPGAPPPPAPHPPPPTTGSAPRDPGRTEGPAGPGAWVRGTCRGRARRGHGPPGPALPPAPGTGLPAAARKELRRLAPNVGHLSPTENTPQGIRGLTTATRGAGVLCL